MSLIDSLNDDKLWLKFLEHKKSSNLPNKVIAKYEQFILNKEYKTITSNINQYTFSIPKKVMIGKMGKSKKRVVYLFEETESYILKMLSYLLYKYDYLFSPNLYSFRQNSGVKKAIYDLTKKNNLNKLYGYKVDI